MNESVEKHHILEQRLQEVQNSHSLEIEEMLQSLDGVEGDYKAKLNEANSLIAQKDAVISAIGMQVVESNTRCEKYESEITRLQANVENHKSETEKKMKEMRQIDKNVELMKAEHETRLKEETNKRSKAVEKMKVDMRKAAEVLNMIMFLCFTNLAIPNKSCIIYYYRSNLQRQTSVI